MLGALISVITSLEARQLTVKNNTQEPVAITFKYHQGTAVLTPGDTHIFKSVFCDLFGEMFVYGFAPDVTDFQQAFDDWLSSRNQTLIWDLGISKEWRSLQNLLSRRFSATPALNEDYAEITTRGIRFKWVGGHDVCG
jgi:hypothetical protein